VSAKHSFPSGVLCHMEKKVCRLITSCVTALGKLAMVAVVWALGPLLSNLIPGVSLNFDKLLWGATAVLVCAALVQVLCAVRDFNKH